MPGGGLGHCCYLPALSEPVETQEGAHSMRVDRLAPSLCPFCLPFLSAQGYPCHNACPLSQGFDLALPAPPKIVRFCPKWQVLEGGGGNQPCCWHLMLLPGRVLRRRQIRRHRNCHGEMQQGNKALNPAHIPHSVLALLGWVMLGKG